MRGMVATQSGCWASCTLENRHLETVQLALNLWRLMAMAQFKGCNNLLLMWPQHHGRGARQPKQHAACHPGPLYVLPS